jgi:glycosyltransferase involved in cell wall biosynthesis
VEEPEVHDRDFHGTKCTPRHGFICKFDAHVTVLRVIAVALDLRDPRRSGIARVATSIARAFVARHGAEFATTLAGPAPELESLGARSWGTSRLVPWRARRYSPLPIEWPRVRARVGRALWYFPHWDVPWLALRESYVVTLHDLAHLHLAGVSPLKRSVARLWMRQSLSGARRILAVSEYSARALVSEWPDLESKLSVALNGVDDTFFAPARALSPGIAGQLGDSPFMLSVGIRQERKNLAAGVDVLLAVPGLRWVVAGEWFPDWEHVAARAREVGVLDRIVCLDRQDEDTLRSLYAAAAFLFFPSRYEGFGLPLLEAMASGTPVVTSNAASLGEVAGDVAWRSDPDDIPGFARAAREILALGSRRAAVAARGREWARQFTWDRAADALADAFRAAARA